MLTKTTKNICSAIYSVLPTTLIPARILSRTLFRILSRTPGFLLRAHVIVVITCLCVHASTAVLQAQTVLRVYTINEPDSVSISDPLFISASRDGHYLGIVESIIGGAGAKLIDAQNGQIVRAVGPSFDLADSMAFKCTCKSINEEKMIEKKRKDKRFPNMFVGTNYYFLVPSTTWYSDSSRLSPSWIKSQCADMCFDSSGVWFYGSTGTVANDTLSPREEGNPGLLLVSDRPFAMNYGSTNAKTEYYPLDIDRKDYSRKRDSAAGSSDRFSLWPVLGTRICFNEVRGMALVPGASSANYERRSERQPSAHYLSYEVHPRTLEMRPGLRYPESPIMDDVNIALLSVVPCVSRQHEYLYTISGFPWVYNALGRRMFPLDTQGVVYYQYNQGDTFTNSSVLEMKKRPISTVVDMAEEASGQIIVVFKTPSNTLQSKSDIIVHRYSSQGTLIRTSRFESSSVCEYTSGGFSRHTNTLYLISLRNEAWTVEEIRL